MKYKKIGRNNINVSAIGLGTHQFGGDWGIDFSQKTVDSIISGAFQNGVNLIDTAACYGPNHLSEKLIGSSIKDNRDDWVLATKFGQSYDNSTRKEKSDFTLKTVKKQFEKSLKYLKTDYIDIYQFHSGSNSDFHNEELWAYLNKQVDKGRIDNLGLSFAHGLVANDDYYQLENLDTFGINIVQLLYNKLTPVSENYFIPYCEKKGIDVLSRVPLAKGFLSGKYSPGHIFSKSDHRYKFGNKMNDELLEKVEKISKKEFGDNVSMSQWAINWCLENSGISSVIVGAKNRDQIISNSKSVLNSAKK